MAAPFRRCVAQGNQSESCCASIVAIVFVDHQQHQQQHTNKQTNKTNKSKKPKSKHDAQTVTLDPSAKHYFPVLTALPLEGKPGLGKYLPFYDQ